MKMITFLAALGMVAGAATIATAHDADARRTDAMTNQSIGIEAVKSSMDRLGYDVQRLELDDGVIEARIIDRVSGLGVTAHFDFATRELLRAALAR